MHLTILLYLPQHFPSSLENNPSVHLQSNHWMHNRASQLAVLSTDSTSTREQRCFEVESLWLQRAQISRA